MANPDEDVAMENSLPKPKSKRFKGHEIQTKTIKTPPYSYVHLELVSESSRIILDNLTVHTYLKSTLSQFLGLTGTAIPIDILKVENSECWIKVPREDLSPILAALGGWIGGRKSSEASVGWRIRASGNWLSVLVGRTEMTKIWGH